MLNAILHSKAGTALSGDDEVTPQRWAALFNGSEDLVTATVFERLRYLPGALAWSILASASGKQLDAFKMVEIREMAYWPSWYLNGRRVEPDLFIEVDLGDPPKRAHIIVEAKHTSNPQTAEQWARELSAYQEMMHTEESMGVEWLLFLAIGDRVQGRSLERRKQTLLDQVETLGHKRSTFDAVLIGWHDIARAVATTVGVQAHEQAVLNDISDALILYGYFNRILPRAIEKMPAHTTGLQSFNLLTEIAQ